MTQRVETPTLYRPDTEHDACGLGFVAHIKGHKSRAIVEDALEILRRLAHRAATGQDPETGDGSGILLQLPHRFFKREALARGWDIPRRRGYGVGMVFLPADETARLACEAAVEAAVRDHGQRVIGWRDVPVCPEVLGPLARALRPVVRQLYIGRRRLVPSAFERKLFVIRKAAEHRVRESGVDPAGRFHIASCSAETIVYKGLMLPAQLGAFYPDLADDDMVSALALVHSRFSTNTQPAWERAQPFRHVAHNGEINTVAGNRNWMAARRRLLKSAKFDGGVDALFPVIVPGGSDSAQFDNMLELLHLGGRSLPHAMMMMIPEAWEAWPTMPDGRRAFYEYAASLMEPWDGPAAIAFTDGHLIGATLDRNGLRPCRYLVTDDDRVILASETGVIDVPPERVRLKDRLRPGRMLIVDTEEGRIIDDDEVKNEISGRWPYRRWLTRNVFRVGDFDPVAAPDALVGEALARQIRAFGYTDEDLDVVMAPMAEEGKEPIGAMGNDTPLAVLSHRAPSLFHYFHQRFAQVTNPPIDPIREAAVMTLECSVGPQGNTFEETPEQCHRLCLDGPVLTNAELARIASLQVGAFEPTTLHTLYRPADGPRALEMAIDALCAAAVEAVDDGYNILILSDRGVDAEHVAMPALLATSAVHHHLIREGIRLHTGLLVSTGEAREVHHFAALIGYGASAVNPWLALDLLADRAADGGQPGLDVDVAAAHRGYIEAIDAGLLKILAKMGISTLQSYRGAQIFEAIGLDRALVERHFADTPSRLGGIDLGVIAREAEIRHERGFGAPPDELAVLPVGGDYRWRRRGEAHRWNPRTIALLQAAAKQDDAMLFAEWEAAADDRDGSATTLRGLFDFVPGDAISLDEVEPASAIVRRFVTGAMSFGSISAEAHETLAIAMNRLGGRSNSGEGGEEPHRSRPDANGDSRRSAIKQVASGRFGVTTDYLVDADDLQIKIAQGAKPGEGGQLPGEKVDERIARVRCSTPGVTLISPPPHHDIYSIEDLKQLIYDLQAVNPTARISVKLVASVGVGTVAAGVAKAGADAIVISGWSGGTGASPLSSQKRAGIPWELGIAEAQQVLVQNGLRGAVRLQVDGGLRTARDVMVAALLGAEEYGFATAALIVEGCVLLRRCHQNTCSVGVATQDPALRARFAGQPEHIVQYMLLLAESLRRLMASLGIATLDEAIGRADRLCARVLPGDAKAGMLDLAPLLTPAPHEGPRRCTGYRARPDDQLDLALLPALLPAIESGRVIAVEQPIGNIHRAVGARLAGEIVRRRPGRPLPDGAITVRFAGSAGQSFGAFLPAGVTFELVGDGNDYLGKGLSGGRLAVRPPDGSRFRAEHNVIIGNTVLYGATGGELYAAGIAGERFAVRNSGASAVVEGCGDHGCEYMTGGVVVVLGPTGRNFAAGMSGGMAFVFDREGSFREHCNPEMVELGAVDEADDWLLRALIEAHVRHTRSALGQLLLGNWKLMVPRFVKVLPMEYRRALDRQGAMPVSEAS